MLKRLFFGLLLMFTATPAMAQLTASEFAEKLTPVIGQQLGDSNIRLVAVRAEGTLAIMTLDSPDWMGQRPNVTKIFSQTFCADGDNMGFFDKMRLRIDTLDNGKGLITGAIVDKCPAPEKGQ